MTTKERDARPGLEGGDNPGQRSGEGSGSVMEQMHKDQQRNSNDKGAPDEEPEAARDQAA
jgi:hypothetical protein